MAKRINLPSGQHALVDDEDYDRLNEHKWCMMGGYASRRITVATNVRAVVRMHRIVAGIDSSDRRYVDHVNGDRLDNRRANLRIADPSQNSANHRRYSTNRSGFMGVSFRRREQRWNAKIDIRGKKLHLGYFSSAEEAARAYDRAALEYRKEFATLNFPAAERDGST